MTSNREAEYGRWILKRIGRDYAARAGVTQGKRIDPWHIQYMLAEYRHATLHERINRRGRMPGVQWPR